MSNFATVLKRLRKSANLTQEELANKLGIIRSRISLYELGRREPDFDTLELIGDFFNVDTDYLLGRTNKTTILPETVGGYYLNDEAKDLAQFMHDSPEYRVLFDAMRDVSPEDIKFVKDMIDRLKRNKE